MLVRCDPENLILEGFYQCLAIHQGWPSLDQLVANLDEHTVRNDWAQVLEYTEVNNPYSSVRAEYVPFTLSAYPLHVYKGSKAGWVLEDEYS